MLQTKEQTERFLPSHTQRFLRCAVRLARALVNVVALSYVVGLIGLLGLRLLGRDHRWWIAFLTNFIPYYFVPVFGLLLSALLTRARPALLAALPLAVVGMVLFGPRFLPKSAPAAGSTLHLVSFNVSDGNQRFGEVVAWLREQGADVVLLQEVSAEWFGPLRQELDTLYPEQIHQLTDQGFRANVTLSRYPLIQAPSVTLDSPQFQPVILEVEGEPTTFYNISLKTPVEAAPRRELPLEYSFLELMFRYDDTARNRQIAQLLAQLELEPAPFVAAGDFNMSDQAGIYGTLATRMGDSFGEVGFGLGSTWPALQVIGMAGWIPPLLRIDYIWHSRQFRALSAEVGPYLGSDHLPITVTLTGMISP